MPRMVTAIRIYPYIAPLVLAPLSLWLWWSRYANWPQALLAWLIPVLWAYIVPGIGTNVRGVWEFNTALKLGRFRPHHGFVFGSATAMLAWLAHGAPAHTLADVARWALLLSALLGFWNWLYEIKALQADVLRVYNQPWADGGGPEAIAYDYAPWIFAGFGAAYGACIAGAEWARAHHHLPLHQPLLWLAWGAAGLLACIAFPLLGFMWASMRRHGHTGTRPVNRPAPCPTPPPAEKPSQATTEHTP